MKSTALLRKLTFSEAIELVAHECIKSGNAPSKIISENRLADLSPEAFERLAILGWISEVNNHLHYSRSEPAQEEQEAVGTRPGTHPISGRNPRGAWRPLENIRMQGADGTLKPLADFTLADVERLRDIAQSQVDGWARRRKWANCAAKLLSAKGAGQRVGALKKSQVEELSKLASEAWL